jgi:hypothetical protein
VVSVPNIRVPSRTVQKFPVRVADLPALQARVSELARPGERDCCERLLGQLATLSRHGSDRDDAHVVHFVPLPGCEDLARRALNAVGAPAFASQRRSRFRRESAA